MSINGVDNENRVEKDVHRDDNEFSEKAVEHWKFVLQILRNFSQHWTLY
jgi:hypothetical protein